jgi:hypothetical protein
MAITKGVNTYVTLAEAFDYFKYRLDTEVWDTAIDARREQALVTATRLLDEKAWVGTVVSESQPLAFPRVGSYFDPRLGYNVSFDPTVVPKRIETATLELAFHIISNEGIVTESSTVGSLKVGTIDLGTMKQASLIPGTVMAMLRPLLANRGINTWWRAN